jgi:integrase
MDLYSLSKRKKENGSFWYVQFKDNETGKYGTAKSIEALAKKLGDNPHHITKKPEAESIARRAIEKGLDGNSKTENPLFRDYLEQFWSFDTSEYIKKQNKKKEGSIHKAYAYNMAGYVKNHVIPLLPKGLKCSQIKMKHIEKIQDHCLETSKSLWLNVQKSIAKPIKELQRKGILLSNPLLNLEHYSQDTNSSVGELTEEETRRLIARMFYDCDTGYKTIEKRGAKNGHLKEVEVQTFLNRRVYLATAVGIDTGMRINEILALRESDIELPPEDSEEECAMIRIKHSYSKHDGLKCTKSNTPRTVPIRLWLAHGLLEWAQTNPHGNGFIFYSDTKPEKPIHDTAIRKWFNRELERIGISEQERKARNIRFHSLRHYYITELRNAELEEEQIRLLTGHSDRKMTDRYDTGDKTNRVKKIAGKVGSLINNPKEQEA